MRIIPCEKKLINSKKTNVEDLKNTFQIREKLLQDEINRLKIEYEMEITKVKENVVISSQNIVQTNQSNSTKDTSGS